MFESGTQYQRPTPVSALGYTVFYSINDFAALYLSMLGDKNKYRANIFGTEYILMLNHAAGVTIISKCEVGAVGGSEKRG